MGSLATSSLARLAVASGTTSSLLLLPSSTTLSILPSVALKVASLSSPPSTRRSPAAPSPIVLLRTWTSPSCPSRPQSRPSTVGQTKLVCKQSSPPPSLLLELATCGLPLSSCHRSKYQAPTSTIPTSWQRWASNPSFTTTSRTLTLGS